MSPKWKETLKYVQWKIHGNVSDTAYEALHRLLSESGVKIFRIKRTRRYLTHSLNLPIRHTDCCVNHHMAFNASERHRSKCMQCGASRFKDDHPQDNDHYFPSRLSYSKLSPKATYPYIPLIPRLKVLAAGKTSAAAMRYPSNLRNNPWEGGNGIRDIWEGAMMKRWVNKGYFDDERTVALHFSADGVQTFKTSTKSKDMVWPFLIMNLNLPPTERYGLGLG